MLMADHALLFFHPVPYKAFEIFNFEALCFTHKICGNGKHQQSAIIYKNTGIWVLDKKWSIQLSG